MKALLLAAVLSLGVLVPDSAHPTEEGAPVPSAGLERGPGRLAERRTALMENLQSYAARARAAAELAAIDQAIAKLEQLLKELQAQKQSELAYEQSVQEYIQQLQASILELQQEIDGLQQDIDDAPWYAGPGLPALLAALNAKLDARREERDGLIHEVNQRQADLEETDQSVARLDELIAYVKVEIRDKQAEKVEVKQELAAVRVTSPSEGTRLLVDSSGELKLRSDQPPRAVRIELERMESGSRDSVAQLGWRPFYNRIWEWKKLDSMAPNVATLGFTTEKPPEARGTTMTASSEAPTATKAKSLRARNDRSQPPLTLYPGEYRVRSSAKGTETSPWRRFSVVGRLGGKALTQPIRPATKGKQPSAAKTPAEPPAGVHTREPSAGVRVQKAPAGDSNDRVQPSVLRRP